jgi:hypothetical protein
MRRLASQVERRGRTGIIDSSLHCSRRFATRPPCRRPARRTGAGLLALMLLVMLDGCGDDPSAPVTGPWLQTTVSLAETILAPGDTLVATVRVQNVGSRHIRLRISAAAIIPSRWSRNTKNALQVVPDSVGRHLAHSASMRVPRSSRRIESPCAGSPVTWRPVTTRASVASDRAICGLRGRPSNSRLSHVRAPIWCSSSQIQRSVPLQ